MINALTEEHIYQSNLIEGIDDPNEDAQSLHAWYLLRNQPKLTHGVIQQVQKMITLNQNDLMPHQRGYYRSVSKVNVVVGDYHPPLSHLVDGMMDNWLLDYEELGPWEAHVRFEKIHPFVDGNGRTGRMLMWWQEIKNGQKPTLIEADKRFEYYKRLNAGRSINHGRR